MKVTIHKGCDMVRQPLTVLNVIVTAAFITFLVCNESLATVENKSQFRLVTW